MDIWVDGKDAVVTEASVPPIRPVIPLAALAIWDPKPPTKLVRSERGHWPPHNGCHRCNNGAVHRLCGLYDVSDGRRAAVSATARRGRTEAAVVSCRSFARPPGFIGRDRFVLPPRSKLFGWLMDVKKKKPKRNQVVSDKVFSLWEISRSPPHVTQWVIIASAARSLHASVA